MTEPLQAFQLVNLTDIEQVAIPAILGILQAVIKNPKTATVLRAQLLQIATDIFAAYGQPVPPAAA